MFRSWIMAKLLTSLQLCLKVEGKQENSHSDYLGVAPAQGTSNIQRYDQCHFAKEKGGAFEGDRGGFVACIDAAQDERFQSVSRCLSPVDRLRDGRRCHGCGGMPAMLAAQRFG